jgi:arylesterase/paraoxonase
MTLRPFALLLVAAVATPTTATHAAANCDAVPVLAADTRQALRGVEDIAIDRTARIAYLSATDRWAVEDELGGPLARTTQGGLYALTLEAQERPLLARPLTRDFTAHTDFHPHGIDLYIAPSGARTLFAVNHRFLHGPDGWRTEQAVEIFDVGEAGLVHRASVIHPFISSPNDVAAAGPDAFYVTNDHGNGGALARAVEDLTGRGLGSVVHVDLARPPAERVRMIATGIAYANGVALSSDHGTIYVAASRDKALLAYDTFHPERAPRTIPLPLGPDNLSWGDDGRMYIAGHPDLLRFALYAKTAPFAWGLHVAPSAAVRISPTESDPAATVESVWHDDGHRLSASTVAAVAGPLMLVGTVYGDRIGVCRLAADPSLSHAAIAGAMTARR